jgi:hypothetical protein
MKIQILITLFVFCTLFTRAQITPIIVANDPWKYLDNGSNQGNAWTAQGFNDVTWATGFAELGYGDGDEASVVSYGPSSSNKYITTYFRKTFTVANPSLFNSLNLQVVRDDGVVVYINGQEVWRNNMPGGTITTSTTANSAIAFGDEDAWQQATISSAFLLAGTNTIAVEIHQESGSSSDISFNLKLDGNLGVISTTADRGPYLNLATSSSVVVKWRTIAPTDSKVKYGISPSNLNQVATVNNFTTNHEVNITGLNPSTIYYYSIGYTGADLTTGSSQIYFKTNPIQGAKGDYKFWVIGDAGTAAAGQRDARDGFLQYTNNTPIDGWIWLGDNAYEGGKDNEYQANVFSNNTYENELKRVVVWPAPGNHDYNNNIPFSPDPAYYDIFTLPTQAEAGGLASGTEKYYSYNIGNVHFLSIDSYDEGRDATDPMAQWIANDLAANTQPWVIAYWHHPPYTKGSHNSDNSNFLDGELVDMRENILPILENGGVDLVLNGHSHCYERSFLIDSHYGYSSSLNASMIKDASSGSYPASCPYQKQTEVNNAHQGTIYTVCGCSGKLSGTSSGWPHPIMYDYTNTVNGSMLLEFKDNRMDAKFINTTGAVDDQFTIVKNAGKKMEYNVCPGVNTTIKPSWPGTVEWFPLGTTQDSVTVNPMVGTTYFAYDALSCITDTFVFNMLTPINCPAVGLLEQKDADLVIYPTTIENQSFINIKYMGNINLQQVYILDVSGKKIELKLEQSIEANKSLVRLPNLSAGIYLIELYTEQERRIVKKIIITD